MNSLVRAVATVIAAAALLLATHVTPAAAASRHYVGTCDVYGQNGTNGSATWAGTSSWNCSVVEVKIVRNGVVVARTRGYANTAEASASGVAQRSDHNWLYSGTWRGFGVTCC